MLHFSSAELTSAIAQFQKVLNLFDSHGAEALLKEPSDHTTWVRCLVPVVYFSYCQDKHGVHVIGATPDKLFYQIAACVSNETVRLYADLLEELRGLAQTYDIVAIPHAQEGFRKYGRGLMRFYRQTILDIRLRAPLERLILTVEIEHSNPYIIERLLLVLVSFGLHVLGDVNSPAAKELLARDRDALLASVLGFNTADLGGQAEDTTDKMPTISLLRSVFVFVGGERDALQQTLAWERSANDNLRELVESIGIRVGKGISLDGFDAKLISDALRSTDTWSKGVLVWAEDAMRKDNIIRSIPVGVSEPNLPGQLVNNIGLDTIRVFQMERFQLHRLGLSLESENNLHLFICICAQLPQSLPALQEWIVSDDGSDYLRRTIAGMFKDLEEEHITLKFAAVVSIERLLPMRSGEVSELIYSSCLQDHESDISLLRRVDCNQMGQSLNRVINHPAAQRLLSRAIGYEDLCPPERLWDLFWSYVLNDRLSTRQAFNKARLESDRELPTDAYDQIDNGWVMGSKEEEELDDAVTSLAGLRIGSESHKESPRREEPRGSPSVLQAGKDRSPKIDHVHGEHTIVYGRGVCQACASQGGMYGINVMSSERRH